MERFILSALTGHVKHNQGIRPTQHGFIKGRCCLTHIFCDRVMHLVDEGKAVDVVCLDFCKAFDTVPPQHPPGETSCSWFGWVYSSLDKELAEWPSTESGGEWS